MSKRPQDTPAEEPDGGYPHIRFRGGPELGNRLGLLNTNRWGSWAASIKDLRDHFLGTFDPATTRLRRLHSNICLA